MDTNQQREAIKKAYPLSKSWPKKVDKMSESQIQAIYIRFKAKGLL